MKDKSATVALPKGVTRSFNFWQDREIRFDSYSSELKLRKRTEVLIAKFYNVEDTKGNNGYDGTLIITNLRIIWYSTQKSQCNLSIGLNTVQSVNRKTTESKLFGGTAESLHIPCRFDQSRFHFIFTAVRNENKAIQNINDAVIKKAISHLNNKSNKLDKLFSSAPPLLPTVSTIEEGREGVTEKHEYEIRLYNVVQATWKAYDTTRTYRELRLRSATIISNNNVILLSGEQVLEKIAGVSHVSHDEGFIGTLVVTNIRFVWFAAQEENFNISLPYLHVVGIHCQHNKYGPTLVLQTSSCANKATIAFRITPVEKLKDTFNVIASFWKAWALNPVIGISVSTLLQNKALMSAHNQITTKQREELLQQQQEQQQQQEGYEESLFITRTKELVRSVKKIRQVNGDNNIKDDNREGAVLLNEVEATESNTENIILESEQDENDENDYDDDEEENEDNITQTSHEENDNKEANINKKHVTRDTFALYYADEGQKGFDRRPVYDVSIGLAVEKLKKGVTLQSLWAVPLPTENDK